MFRKKNVCHQNFQKHEKNTKHVIKFESIESRCCDANIPEQHLTNVRHILHLILYSFNIGLSFLKI